MNDSPIIADVEITTDADGRFNLNSLHRASGEGANKAPAQWLRSKQAKEFIAEVEKQTVHICIVSAEGRNGGTFAHELVAVEYAGWISPAFRIKVNQTFIDYRTGKLSGIQTHPKGHADRVVDAERVFRSLSRLKSVADKSSPETLALLNAATIEATGIDLVGTLESHGWEPPPPPPSPAGSPNVEAMREPVTTWLGEQEGSEFTGEEILVGALGLIPERGDLVSLGYLMRELKWHKRRARRDGMQRQVWCRPRY